MNAARRQVRADCPQCAGGSIGHMTADELLDRSTTTTCDLSCPVCGRIHLGREEIDQLNRQRIVNSVQYRQIRRQAEAVGFF